RVRHRRGTRGPPARGREFPGRTLHRTLSGSAPAAAAVVFRPGLCKTLHMLPTVSRFAFLPKSRSFLWVRLRGDLVRQLHHKGCSQGRSFRQQGTKQMRTMVSRLAISAALLMLVAVGVANAQNCSSSIQACGCTINSAGAYTVDSDLTAAQGLTSRGSCIDVAAANVKLFTNGHNITGAGTGTGVGINLLSTAGSLFLAAAGPNSTYTTVSGWQYGMQSLADNVTSEGFYFTGNTTGVLIKDGDNNNVSCFGAYNNSVY